MIDKFFKLTENKTNVKTEVIAGITTFMTMAYILVVNPQILSETGMDFGALVTATALSAVIATLVMAFLARLPFALAPGMGLNAFFTFTVVKTMGYSWQFALTAVFIEGILFLLMSFFNIREIIVNSIPLNIKHSVSVGIGLFITLIGLQNAGIVVDHPATLLTLGDVTSPGALVAIIGILLTGVLLAKNIKGALLIGILTATVIGFPMGITKVPENFSLVSAPPSLAPIFFQMDFSNIFSVDKLIVVFTFLFVDLFDTVGTLVGVASKANMLDEDGKFPKAKPALIADAVGTTCGSILGTSTVTTWVESAAGIAEGGRTGLTSLTTAGMFFLALFFAPLFIMIPKEATSPALVMVGLFMLSPIMKINLDDYTEAIPAFLTIIFMPLTFSIAEGIVFGFLSYIVLKVLSGKYKDVSWVMYIIGALFILKFWVH
jgi:AGZA family xanthine/uracil permease-like MFS transporter